MRLVVDLQGFQSIGSRMRGIGRYSLSLALAMARAPRGHDLLIALNDAIPDIIESGRALFEPLLPRENIIVWSALEGADALMPERSWRRNVGGLLFEDAMARLQPDIVHVSSLFEGWSGDVVSSVGKMASTYSTAVTLYDLIPMQSPDTYLVDPRLRNWYEDRVAHLRRADLFLAISEHSRQEGIELLGIEPERVVNISGSCSELFRPVTLDPLQRLAFNAKHGISRPYLLYTGGFDSRKNVPALIRAFADLPPEIRGAHQLVVAGYAPPQESAQLVALRDQCGLRPDECILTGYVPDADLLVLYSNCRLYVFPSLREGFGLPILEAMSCGAAVIGANRTSLPEVIGLEEAMFDPEDGNDMRNRMLQALTDEEFRERLHKHALVQSRRFSWAECADKAWDGFEKEYDRRRSERTVTIPLREQGRVLTILPGNGGEAYAGHPDVLPADFAVTDTEGDDATAAIAAKLAPYTAILVLVDDARTLHAAVRLLQYRACWVHVCGGVQLKDLCLRTVGASDLPGWAWDLAVTNGRYALLGEQGPHARLVEFLASWIEAAAAAVMHHPALPSVVEWREEVCRVGMERVGQDQNMVLRKVGELEPAPALEDASWLHAAESLTWNRSLDQWGGRLLIDITEFVKRDAGTGIQRVVRNIVRELVRADHVDLAVQPIYLDAAGAFRHAHRKTLALLGIERDGVSMDGPVEWRHGDIFLGLDLSADAIRTHPQVFERMKHRGVAMYFVVYDLIPLLRADCVDTGAVPVFQHWYRMIAQLADGLVCISRAVADELMNWLDQAKPVRQRALSVGYFHLGADLDGQIAQAGTDGLPMELHGRGFVLMVGTLEPRKGYAQALAAFDLLWEAGEDIALVIVGKQGWMMESLAARMRSHPRSGHLFFWYEHASDSVLQALYTHARFLLCASEAEGFGLPIIEGAQRGLPILARDIAVFREVAGDFARYFDGIGANELTTAVRDMLQEDALLARQRISAMPWISWKESAEQLFTVVRNARWYARHTDSHRHWFYATDPRLGTDVGERVGGAIHSSGRSGLLVHGPLAAVASGHYRLRLHGRFSTGASGLGLDVTSERGTLVLLREEMTISSPVPVTLYETQLDLARDVPDLEIRVRVAGSREAVILALELLPEYDGHAGATSVRGRRPKSQALAKTADQ